MTSVPGRNRIALSAMFILLMSAGSAIRPTLSEGPVLGFVELDLFVIYPLENPDWEFDLWASMLNRGPAIEVEFYLILEFSGQYWFWPAWTRELDYSRYMLEENSETTCHIIHGFCFGPDSMVFRGALLDHENGEPMDRDVAFPCHPPE